MKAVRQGAQVQLRAKLKDYHRIATSLADALADIRRLEDEIKQANNEAAAAGRSDLVMPSIYRELTAKMQAQFEKHYAAQGARRPANDPLPVASPVPRGDFGHSAVRLSGYFPPAPKSDKPFDAPPLSFIE